MMTASYYFHVDGQGPGTATGNTNTGTQKAGTAISPPYIQGSGQDLQLRRADRALLLGPTALLGRSRLEGRSRDGSPWPGSRRPPVVDNAGRSERVLGISSQKNWRHQQ